MIIYAQVLEDFVGRIGKTNTGGKIEDLYFELNKWSFESKFQYVLLDIKCLEKINVCCINLSFQTTNTHQNEKKQRSNF